MDISYNQILNEYIPPSNIFITFEESDYEWLQFFKCGKIEKINKLITIKDVYFKDFSIRKTDSPYVEYSIEFASRNTPEW